MKFVTFTHTIIRDGDDVEVKCEASFCNEGSRRNPDWQLNELTAESGGTPVLLEKDELVDVAWEALSAQFESEIWYG